MPIQWLSMDTARRGAAGWRPARRACSSSRARFKPKLFRSRDFSASVKARPWSAPSTLLAVHSIKRKGAYLTLPNSLGTGPVKSTHGLVFSSSA